MSFQVRFSTPTGQECFKVKAKEKKRHQFNFRVSCFYLFTLVYMSYPMYKHRTQTLTWLFVNAMNTFPMSVQLFEPGEVVKQAHASHVHVDV